MCKRQKVTPTAHVARVEVERQAGMAMWQLRKLHKTLCVPCQVDYQTALEMPFTMVQARNDESQEAEKSGLFLKVFQGVLSGDSCTLYLDPAVGKRALGS